MTTARLRRYPGTEVLSPDPGNAGVGICSSFPFISSFNIRMMIQEILASTSWQEWAGVGFSMVQVVLARNNDPYNYPFGIAGILLTLYVMFVEGLYAEFGLNIYYLVMSIYGWSYWISGKQHKERSISSCEAKDWGIVAGIVLASFSLFVLVLKRLNDADVIYYDAAVSAFAWAGMWLMARRKVENWILLNISNLIAVRLFIYKGMYLYAFLSVFLFVVAVMGYFHWRALLKKSREVGGHEER